MIKTLPTSQLIIGYKDIFNEPPPDNRLNLISQCSKKVLLGELCGLNYRLKSKDEIYQNTKREKQIEELHYFCGSVDMLFNQVWNQVRPYLQNPTDYGLLFHRAGCLFAMEEIILSNLPEDEGFNMSDSWLALLKYILAVNSKITSITDAQPPPEQEKSLENLNPKIIPLNELSISTNPFLTAMRGYNLLEFLSNHAEFGQHLQEYFQQKYQCEPGKFIFDLTRLYFANNIEGENNIVNEHTGNPIDTNFYYQLNDETDIHFFNQLAGQFQSVDPEKMISIKKYPFFKADNHVFLLTDNVLAIDKCYNQFINDFWFDYLKPLKKPDGTERYKMQNYRSAIGYFLEDYCKKVFGFMFNGNKHIRLKMFEELKIKVGKNKVELSDIYIRHNKKIVLAEVKSTGLYDDAKFSGDINTFYTSGREDFFKSFGLDQLAKSIENIDHFEKIDPEFPKGKAFRIYPLVIVNEKALQTPLMAQIFNIRFNELVDQFRTPKITISPVSIIHVSDLEQMQECINEDQSMLWEILQYHIREPKFMPPFFNSLIRKNIKPSYEKVMALYIQLFANYYPDGLQD